MNFVIPEEVSPDMLPGVPERFVHKAPLVHLGRAVRERRIRSVVRPVLDEAAMISRYGRELQAQVVLGHGSQSLSSALAARKGGLPYVLLLHGNLAPPWTARILSAVRQPVLVGYELEETYRRYPRLMANAPHTLLLRPAALPPIDANGLNSPNGGPLRIGFVGAFTPGKRADKFLSVAERIHGLLPGAYAFHLVGVPQPEYAEWARVHVSDRLLHMSGSGMDIMAVENPEDMNGFYRSLDLLAILSDSEGIPNAALEALVHGVPVVSLSLPGLSALQKLSDESSESSGSLAQVSRGKREITRFCDAVLLRAGQDPDREGRARRWQSILSPEVAAHDMAMAFGHVSRAAT